MPNLKVKCKQCGKEFVATSNRATICFDCKKKNQATRRAKRKQGEQMASQLKKPPVKKSTAPKTSNTGNLQKGLLDQIFDPVIWEQRPVDIETFLFDRNYLGNSWLDSGDNRTMFPSWQEYSKIMFPLPMRSPYNTIILSGATGLGKQQPNSCEILTPTGSIKFGDIKIGDEILGLDGKPQRVIGVFPQTDRRVYEVILNDGSSTRCGPEHLWTVGLNSHGEIKWQTLTLEEILKKAEHRGRFGCRGGKAVLLPRIQPIEYSEKKFNCDPYVLGALLGDGVLTIGKHKDRPLTLSSGDSDIPFIIGKRLNSSFKKHSSNYNWNFSIGGKNLKQSEIVPTELLGLGSYNKYIPEEYFYGSVEQRLDLLRGLMDTDGSAIPSARDGGRSKCHFSSVSKALAEGVIRLARSLGMFATIKEYHRIKTYKGGSKEKTSYKVSINSDTFCPFLIEKKSSIWTPAKQFVNRKFREVRYWGEEDSTCIKVSNPDEMYLTNDYIPTHNTSIAMGVCLAYYLHVVMCLRDPHQYFGLADQKPIIFANINIVTKTMAYKNAWGMINKMLIDSPWFMERGGKTEGKRPEWYCTTKPIELIYGRGPDDLIGLDILFCFMDEISFYRNQSVDKQIQAATEVFNAAWERMKSRFLKFGGIFEGLMVMASSKRTDQSFMESFIKTVTEGVEADKVLVIDRARWEMLPVESFSGKKFPVAVGDKFRPSTIIKEDQVDEYTKAGYKIIWPPIENYSEFDRDMNNALTNIAGISVGQISSFIRGDLVNSCIDPNRQNLFTKSVIFSGYKDSDQYYEYVDLSRMRPEDFTLPLFVHLDASLGGDGNSIVGVLADYAVNKSNVITGNIEPELHYRQLFKIKVRAPQGTHTGLNKNKQFIFWLSQHFNLRGVSRDQFQSEEFAQDLDRAGISVVKQSIDAVKDRICQPYEVLRNAMYEGRVTLLDDEDQTNELVSLEKHESGKIDKPQGGCFTGDTKVRLVDGRSLSMVELVDEFNSGKTNFVYSIDLTAGVIEAKPISRAWLTRRNQKLVKVLLDNGEEIKCTPDHPFMGRDGNYIKAEDLVRGTPLMPLYTKYPSKGLLTKYRLVYQPMLDQWNYEHQVFSGVKLKKGFVIHHRDCDRGNNNPTNLVQLSRDEHVQVHQLLSTGACSPEAIAKRTDSRLKWYREIKGSDYGKEIKRKIRKGVFKFYGKDLDEIELSEKTKILWVETNSGKKYSELTQNEKSGWGVKYHINLNPEFREVCSSTLSSFNSKTSSERSTGRSWYNNGIYEKFLKPGDIVPEGYVRGRAVKLDTHIKQGDRHWGKIKDRRNHKVVSVTWLEETQDVYDLTIPDNHNFALDSGVFVHNCDDTSQCLAGAVYLASKAKEELLSSGIILLQNIGSSGDESPQVDPSKTIEQVMERHFSQYSPEAIMAPGRSSIKNNWESFFGKEEDKKKTPSENITIYWG